MCRLKFAELHVSKTMIFSDVKYSDFMRVADYFKTDILWCELELVVNDETLGWYDDEDRELYLCPSILKQVEN